MWWMKDPERARREVAQIETLRDSAAWLHVVGPIILPGLDFAVDFELEIAGQRQPFRLAYPAFYPSTPPSVTPRDGAQVSGHQYNTTGELCLEYRSDNWDPRVTGAMMIESAYRLVSTESGIAGVRTAVPSAHCESQGQRLRGRFCRFLRTRSVADAVRALPAQTLVSAKVSEIYTPKAFTAILTHTGEGDTAVAHTDTPVPPRVSTEYPAYIFRTDQHLTVPPNATREDLQAIADTAVLSTESHFLILDDPSRFYVFLLSMGEGATSVFSYHVIDVSQDVSTRLPSGYAGLTGKKVGLVGAGSVGSKIATSLARSGVKSFVLIDDDLFLPGNLVRNDLDAASLGSHKVDALEARLKAVASGVEVHVRRIVFGGQEASGSTAAAFAELVACDVLVDATADPRTFNLIGAAAEAGRRPFVWAEVYAGGAGGFVGRVRPDREPPPHAARRQCLDWWAEQDIVWQASGASYDGEDQSGVPMIASDADVSVIAAHAARMVLDVLLDPNSTMFPHSGYVIGLHKTELFQEPFDTRPIDFLPDGAWGEAPIGEPSPEAAELIIALVKKAADANQA